MAIEFEHRLTFAQLAQREDVHIATVWRWTKRGCKGKRLESFRLGGKRYTSAEAFARWLRAINKAETEMLSLTDSQSAIARAEQRAEELGA